MGIIIEFFQMDGMEAVETEMLKILVRNRIPRGPRCLRCRTVRPSGPRAEEFLAAAMASFTMSGVKGEKSLLRGCSAQIQCMRRRVEGLWA